MQGSSRWHPPGGTLGALLHAARARAARLEERRDALEVACERRARAPAFAAALRGPAVALLAEVKRRSPSRGAINPELDAAARAHVYAEAGAAAISVLTEPDQFGGAPDDVAAVRAAVTLPVLKKDFHVEPVQLLEACALGASAALLIVRALAPAQLLRMAKAARALELELLLEVRDEEELARALDAGAAVVGVNNRDLETLEIDASTTDRVLPHIPAHCIAVAESGVRDRGDVERCARAGADAVLVGSVLSAAADPSAAARALAGVARRSRG